MVNNLPKNEGRNNQILVCWRHPNTWLLNYMSLVSSTLWMLRIVHCDDCISVKISYTELVMNLQTDDWFKWEKKENQKHFSRHLRANRYNSFLICRTFFISLSMKPKTEYFFFRFFYCLFLSTLRKLMYAAYTLRIRVEDAGLFKLYDYWGCDCIAFALVIFPHWTKDTDRQIKMHWFNSHSMFFAPQSRQYFYVGEYWQSISIEGLTISALFIRITFEMVHIFVTSILPGWTVVGFIEVSYSICKNR